MKRDNHRHVEEVGAERIIREKPHQPSGSVEKRFEKRQKSDADADTKQRLSVFPKKNCIPAARRIELHGRERKDAHSGQQPEHMTGGGQCLQKGPPKGENTANEEGQILRKVRRLHLDESEKTDPAIGGEAPRCPHQMCDRSEKQNVDNDNG